MLTCVYPPGAIEAQPLTSSNQPIDVLRPDWWTYPDECQQGHPRGPGRVIVSWMPCACEPAREAQACGPGPSRVNRMNQLQGVVNRLRTGGGVTGAKTLVVLESWTRPPAVSEQLARDI
jgi:hypothetical protein